MNVESRIRKLLRIAAQDTGPQGKAAEATARRLMAKYRVVVDLHPSEDKDYETRRLIVAKIESVWWRLLLPALSLRHGCNAYFMPHPDGNAMMIATGPGHRIESLLHEVTNWCRRFDVMGGRMADASFRTGCAQAVSEVMAKERKQLARRHKFSRGLVPLIRHAPGEPAGGQSRARSNAEEEEIPSEWTEPVLNPTAVRAGYMATRRNILGIFW